MEIEKQRGISVATSVMGFEYSGKRINILDTPGHKDFAEDTYRTLSAVDSVILVVDCVKVVERLQAENVDVYSVEQVEHSIMLNNFSVSDNVKYALVFGNEVKGVSQEVIDMSKGVIEIPQLGTKHSLNISVSAGIVIWDLFQKLQALK